MAKQQKELSLELSEVEKADHVNAARDSHEIFWGDYITTLKDINTAILVASFVGITVLSASPNADSSTSSTSADFQLFFGALGFAFSLLAATSLSTTTRLQKAIVFFNKQYCEVPQAPRRAVLAIYRILQGKPASTAPEAKQTPPTLPPFIQNCAARLTQLAESCLWQMQEAVEWMNTDKAIREWVMQQFPPEFLPKDPENNKAIRDWNSPEMSDIRDALHHDFLAPTNMDYVNNLKLTFISLCKWSLCLTMLAAVNLLVTVALLIQYKIQFQGLWIVLVVILCLVAILSVFLAKYGDFVTIDGDLPDWGWLKSRILHPPNFST